MNARPALAETLFNDALALPAANRPAFLAQRCGTDAGLLAKVSALLAAHDSSSSVFDQPLTLSPTSPDEFSGEMLGRYRLLERLGEGGCGAVWAAEQREPVRRRVALKIIKLGMDTRQVIARFEAERQALAMMDHPNIAKMLDAGATSTGRPFFVMELVRGIPIMTYCDENHLTTADRLRLLIKVCRAIQHAHQKGIIHRDIKPSNVLVTLHDGEPVPKVIDFGIAKATQQELTDKTVYTKFQQFIGTPAYMSPEQAEMSGLDIDTRADIYSLGVLGYELVTGRTPFDSRQLLQQGVDEIRRTIREAEPPRPSTRLETLQGEELTSTARRRSTEPRKLAANVRGDLDWVVMKCLEKDRTRRYETANGLAMDLDRYLAHEPVLARPPSAVYRTRKFVRRHRVALVAATAVLGSIVAGSIFAALQARRALRAERAENQLLESTRRAELAAAAAQRVAQQEQERNARIRWVRESALPEINRLINRGEAPAAYALACQAETVIPDDPALTSLWPIIATRMTIETTPAGAEVYMKPLKNPTAEWEYVGRTPLVNVRLPSCSHRWLLKKEGFIPSEKADGWAGFARSGARLAWLLDADGTIPAEMVRVKTEITDRPGASFAFGDYLLDRFEVTNREFKRFVDQGGYRTERFWRNPFVREGRTLPWAEAMDLFRDRTGQPGPANWQDGTYRANEADYPVTGVSWFEAAAFAEFAGKRLPSVKHWRWAADRFHAELIVPLSNFAPGLAPVGRYQGIAECGAFDLLGNAREWVWNEGPEGTRCILGGCAGEPEYMFTHNDARPPFDRSPSNGFRCLKLITPLEATQLADVDAPVSPATARNFYQEHPVSDDQFEAIRRRFAYTHSDPDGRLEATDDTNVRWRKEKVSFATAYGRDRMTAYLFLPRNVTPPFQVIVYFPGTGATFVKSSDLLTDMRNVDLLVEMGRAVIYPVYDTTYERATPDRSARTPFEGVELQIHLVQDVSRTLDYLETRPDIAPGKFAYAGFSWGANIGPLVSAIEPRLKANLLAAGGLRYNYKPLPEADSFNYTPRVKAPTLMINGRSDFVNPLETAQKPMFDALGTPPEHKRHLLIDAGHAIALAQVRTDIADWLDRYLGPVK
ncbi:MAG TPA: protein kinase [Lacunisphaera sp.]|nr:protein kinase [Lacunisphaera sp.]